MRKPVVVAVLTTAALIVWATPTAASHAATNTMPFTNITVNGSGGAQTYMGVGGVLGGGGNARYLMDYPEQERSQILDYLFKPGYGAALQLLKVEIGGGANSTDGSEPSVEPVQGQVNCDAGYELSIAAQAVARNRNIKLYGLQWAAPGWVGDGGSPSSLFTPNDITYLIDWLNCAKQYGLTINYLGGWNESDGASSQHPSSYAWYQNLRTALDNSGYSNVQLIAGDLVGADRWQYVSDPTKTPKNQFPDIDILGAHDMCGNPTEQVASPPVKCTPPEDSSGNAVYPPQPLWASELGMVDAGANTGCTAPCAPAMDRALIRGYHEAQLTGYLPWPVIDAMPPGLPHENRGLITADQPWPQSGNYTVNAMTWAIAQMTQFASPPTSTDPGWSYENSSTNYLQANSAAGSYVTLVHNGGDAWSTILETTINPNQGQQRANFTITGGTPGLTSETVHVWASNFNFTGGSSPATWFVQQPDIHPQNGKFSIVLNAGWVYSLTTTTGQGKGTATAPAAANFPQPYTDSLATSGQAGAGDDQPQYLAAQDGSFELAPCNVPDGANTTCTEQTTVAQPVFWHGTRGNSPRYPYATIGDASLLNYTVAVDALLTQAGTTAGVIGRFNNRADGPLIGHFDGYVFDVSTTGAWQLIKNSSANGPAMLDHGTLTRPLGTNTWHRLSMAINDTSNGAILTPEVDGVAVTSHLDPKPGQLQAGPAGIETGAFTDSWPNSQFSNLSVTP